MIEFTTKDQENISKIELGCQKHDAIYHFAILLILAEYGDFRLNYKTIINFVKKIFLNKFASIFKIIYNFLMILYI